MIRVYPSRKEKRPGLKPALEKQKPGHDSAFLVFSQQERDVVRIRSRKMFLEKTFKIPSIEQLDYELELTN